MPEIFPDIPCPARVPDLVWVYILQTADGALYIGQTSNVSERLRKHRYRLGSKFTSDHLSPRLVFGEGPMSLNEAVARERQLKHWSRDKKEALIRGDLPGLKKLSRSRSTALSLTRQNDPRLTHLTGSNRFGLCTCQ